jgi:alpha-tubulin suppressor-like RCC1 family protein
LGSAVAAALDGDGAWVGTPQVQWSVQPGPAVAQVSCGFGHTLLLDRQGGVWACGYAGDGALGVGRDQPNALAPRYVAALEGVRVTAVSAGGLHSLALGDGGAVYAWGQGQHGRLGLGDDQPRWTPTLSPLPDAVADTAVQVRE